MPLGAEQRGEEGEGRGVWSLGSAEEGIRVCICQRDQPKLSFGKFTCLPFSYIKFRAEVVR